MPVEIRLEDTGRAVDFTHDGVSGDVHYDAETAQAMAKLLGLAGRKPFAALCRAAGFETLARDASHAGLWVARLALDEALRRAMAEQAAADPAAAGLDEGALERARRLGEAVAAAVREAEDRAASWGFAGDFCGDDTPPRSEPTHAPERASEHSSLVAPLVVPLVAPSVVPVAPDSAVPRRGRVRLDTLTPEQRLAELEERRRRDVERNRRNRDRRLEGGRRFVSGEVPEEHHDVALAVIRALRSGDDRAAKAIRRAVGLA